MTKKDLVLIARAFIEEGDNDSEDQYSESDYERRFAIVGEFIDYINYESLEARNIRAEIASQELNLKALKDKLRKTLNSLGIEGKYDT